MDPLSLLITDDDRDFRETLCGVFEPRGFRTLSAGDGTEALRIVETEAVHLLLIDMHMPKLTGLETLRRVRQRHLVLPCILMSARLDERLTAAALAESAFAVLAKPIRFTEIMTRVEQALAAAYGRSR